MRIPAVGKLLVVALAGYGMLCLLLAALQRKLMYFPSRATETDSTRRARSLGLEAWRDAVGSLQGWRRPGRSGGTRVLVFHGNAGSALDRTYYLPLLGTGDRDVILFEYPGYGPRSGAPSQKAMVEAALQALARVQNEAPGPVWLVGESLGGGVACAVAGYRPAGVAGLVLVTPFARMTEVAACHYPFLPVRLLLRDRWDNVEALARFPGPVGLFIAGRDEVVGAEQGRSLAAALGSRARRWEQPSAGHNTWENRPDQAPWVEIRAFLAGPAAAP